MGCLYCGKEIGPFRLLRDDEFCSATHRQRYSERLGKALDRIAAPEPRPTTTAGFLCHLPVIEGERRSTMRNPLFGLNSFPIQLPQNWEMGILPASGAHAAFLNLENRAGTVSATLAVSGFRSTVRSALATEAPALGVAVLELPANEEPLYPLPEARSVPGVPRHHSGMLARGTAPTTGALALSLAELEMPGSEEPLCPLPEPLGAPAEPKLHPGILAGATALAPDAPAATASETELPGWGEPRPLLPVPVSSLAEPKVHRGILAATSAPLAPGLALSQSATAGLPIAGAVAGQAALCVSGVPDRLESALFWTSSTACLATLDWAVDVCEPEPAESESESESEAETEPSQDATLPPAGFLALEYHCQRAKGKAAPALELLWPASKPAMRQAEFTLTGTETEDPAGPEVGAGNDASVPDLVQRFIPLDFYCQRGGGTVAHRDEWCVTPPAVSLPPITLQPVFERQEEQVPQRPASKKPAFAEIFSMPEAAARRVQHQRLAQVMRLAAAGIALTTIVWLGSNTERIGQQFVATNQFSAANRAPQAIPERVPETVASEPSSPGPLAQFRRAIAERAAVQLSDDFRDGMKAWGAEGKAQLAGWTRHPEGYVQTGKLALYQPSLTFADYRLDFFGHVENKGMGWVVRAKDHKNYYAMKVKIVEPGLRPIIAIEHYPVVGGKKGHRVEMPLNVMVHNNQPYHVAVTVKGNHFVASIEGQEVQSWTDDVLASGGVGFFSENEERARLYWMRISKNQDFIGRICGYLSGTGAEETARVMGPGSPAELPHPQHPAPTMPDATLAAVVAGRSERGEVRRIRAYGTPGIARWNC